MKGKKYYLTRAYESFLSKATRDFFREKIVFSSLPPGYKAFVGNVPKIVVNKESLSLDLYYCKLKEKETEDILFAFCLVTMVHENIHFIRRFYNDEEDNDIFLDHTPNTEKAEKIRRKVECGESLNYYIF